MSRCISASLAPLHRSGSRCVHYITRLFEIPYCSGYWGLLTVTRGGPLSQHQSACWLRTTTFNQGALTEHARGDLGGSPRISKGISWLRPTTIDHSRAMQAGRAGRREQASASIYIAFDGPLDQYFMTNPRGLFERPIESAQVHLGHSGLHRRRQPYTRRGLRA